MSSKSSYSKTVKRTTVQETELVPVRSNIFYGLETKKVDEKKKSSERNIAIVPNILFYDSYTKAMIDFSDYKNNKEKSNIKDFFDLITPGFNFTITNGTWKNVSVDKLTFDLSGTYKLVKIVDSIVFVEIVSLNKVTETITRYDKESFLELPIFELPTVISKTKKEIKSYLINSLGKTTKSSFSYMGIYAGDYLQIQNNDKKFKIISIEEDTEGKEVITVEGEVGVSSNIGTPILVTLFQENYNKIDTNKFNNEVLGTTTVSIDFSSFCLDNTTELQAKLRENTLKKTTTAFTANVFCSPVVSITSQQFFNRVREVANTQSVIAQSTESTAQFTTLSTRAALNKLYSI